MYNDLKCLNFTYGETESCSGTLNNETKQTSFCANPHIRNTCVGDEGGPIVCDNKIVGIIQNSEDCNDSDRRLFTKLDVYFQWINKTLAYIEDRTYEVTPSPIKYQ